MTIFCLKHTPIKRLNLWLAYTAIILILALIWQLHSAQAAGQYRVKLTVDHSKIAANLTDFPVYVDLEDMPINFWNEATSNCGDIRIFAADGTTELPREVVSCDTAAKTGELYIKTNLASSSDTELIIQVDGTSSDYAVIDPYGAENVWTGYALVSHKGGGVDSTANGNSGTGYGGITIGDVTGRIGKATEFDGSNDYIEIASTSSLSMSSAVLIDLWVKPKNDNSLQMWVDNRSGNLTGFQFFKRAGGNIELYINNSQAAYVSNSNIPVQWAGNWHHLVAVYESGQGGKIFFNGVNLTDDSIDAGSITGTNRLTIIGARVTKSSLWHNGLLDEVRISDSIHSNNWIAAIYANQDSPNTFYSVSSLTSGSLSADIVDSNGDSVINPSIAMSSVASAFECATSTGTLGTANQRIRLNNTTTSPAWSLSLAATDGSSALWSSQFAVYDYNDLSGSPIGCSPGNDSDTYAGVLGVSFNNATLSPQSGCSLSGVALGANNNFAEGTQDAITLLSANTSAATNCYWDLTDLQLEQRIPTEQPAGSYVLSMTLTVLAN